MNDLRAWLTEADPVRREPHLAAGDVERMRRAVLDARIADRGRQRTPSSIIIGAALFVAVLGGVLVSRTPPAVETPHFPAATVERRQVHFATPGGTRIIWTLDPGFKLQEAMP